MIARPLVPPAVSAVSASSGRLPFGFGPRFFLLLAGGGLIVVPAWLDGRVLWILALWNLVVFGVWYADLNRMPTHGSVRVTRSWPSPLSLGVQTRVALELRNETDHALEIEVLDDAPAELRRDFARTLLSLLPGEQKTASYEVLPRRRGDVHVGNAWLRIRTPWALAERWMTADIGQAVRVYPDLIGARQQSLLLLRSRQVSLEKRRARAVGRGREFESLRDYQPGDELRDISWPTTARRGKPITRIFQPERSQAVWILVDGGRLLRARVGERTKLDLLVDAALALAQVVEGAGDRIGLLTYGRTLHQRLAPARGSQHLRGIFEALATVPAERAEADHAGAAAAVMSAQKQRALIVWLTELAETAGVPDVVENATKLSPRHLVLFGVMKPADVSAAAAAAPESSEGMYRMLAAQETLDRREVLLRSLTHRGAHVVELERHQSTAMLIDRYLQIKERSLI
jgi:uncharacterized protein (DUF58 family)